MLAHVESYAGDPILSLMETFGKDSRADKVNLSIGLYYDAEGRIPQLACVATAQKQLAEGEQAASVYLPMEGLAAYHPDRGRFGRAEGGCRFPQVCVSGFSGLGQ